MPIKTFRALIKDADTDIISLHTNNGETGYRIVKLQIIAEDPGSENNVGVLKVYKIPQSGTPTSKIDLSDNTLIAVATYIANTDKAIGPQVVIADREVFNQDIYITYQDAQNKNMNYYIELEQMKMDLSESTVATLKDIRNVYSQIST